MTATLAPAQMTAALREQPLETDTHAEPGETGTPAGDQARAGRPGRGPLGSAAAWVRAHPLAAFLLWFFTLAWLPAFATTRVDIGLPPQLFILATNALGLLGVVVAVRLTDGPDGLRALARRTAALRAPAGWYAFALLSVAAFSLPIAVAMYGPPQVGAEAVLAAQVSGLVLQTVVGLLTNNLWEEVTWMGFVQARLQGRHGAMRAALLTAPLFLVQHLPLQSGSAAEIAIFVVAGSAIMVPFRAVLAWVYNRTGSLFLVGLLHAASNAAAGGVGFGPGLLPRLYPDQAAGSLHVLGTAVLGLAVIALTRGRLGSRAGSPAGGR